MNSIIKTFNVPVGNELFEVKISHDQYLNKMIIKVNGEIQTTKKPWKIDRTIDEYQFEIGNKPIVPRMLREAALVTIITRKMYDTYTYLVKIDGRMLQKYKEACRGKFLAWRINVDEGKAVTVYLDKNNNALWFGGRRIGRIQYQANEFLMWFTIFKKPGEITQGNVNRKLEYICTYNGRRCRPVDFELEDIRAGD
ncbi:unnamed protein product [Caenorhabditis brenneri]